MNAKQNCRPMFVGVMGLSGSGKDTIADYLVKNHEFIKIAFADKVKEVAKDLFGFSDEQLWGPSEKRNEPDERYVQCYVIDSYHQDQAFPKYLTPRYVLQRLGTEFGRDCYPNLWLDIAIKKAFGAMEQGKNVVISDVRFPNEVNGLKEVGAKVLLVNREVILRGDASQHASETSIGTIDPSLIDATITNTDSLETLFSNVRWALDLE
jgi:hypothetical protein